MGAVSNHDDTLEEKTNTGNQSSVSADEVKTNITINVQELKAILDKYQPHTWLRFIARYSLGYFFESFRYSQPVYQLKQLCVNGSDNCTLTNADIINALQQSSFFDLKHGDRINQLKDQVYSKMLTRIIQNSTPMVSLTKS